jgi:hypothetical protein
LLYVTVKIYQNKKWGIFAQFTFEFCKNTIEIKLKEITWKRVNWVHPAKNGNKCWAVVTGTEISGSTERRKILD